MYQDDNNYFDKIVNLMGNLSFIRILKSTNVKIEYINQFTENHEWQDTIESLDFNVDNLFTASIRFECYDFDRLKDMLESWPCGAAEYFTLDKNMIFLPNDGYEESDVYTITFRLNPAGFYSKADFQEQINEYLSEILLKTEQYLRK